MNEYVVWGGGGLAPFCIWVSWYPEVLSTFPWKDFWSFHFSLSPHFTAWLVQGYLTWAKGNVYYKCLCPFWGQLQEWWLQVACASLHLLAHSSIPQIFTECLLCIEKSLCQAPLPFTHPNTCVSQTFKGLPWDFTISGMYSGEGGRSESFEFSAHGLRLPLSYTTYLVVSSTEELCLPHRIVGKIKLYTYAKHLEWCMAQNKRWLGKC